MAFTAIYHSDVLLVVPDESTDSPKKSAGLPNDSAYLRKLIHYQRKHFVSAQLADEQVKMAFDFGDFRNLHRINIHGAKLVES